VPVGKPDFPALTGLRFLAASLVMYGHLGNRAFYGFEPDLLEYRHAVSFFFVLSGFVLASAYPEIEGKAERRRFWVLRAARLWPTHLFILAVMITAFGNWPSDGAGWTVLSTNVLLVQSWLLVDSLPYTYNSPAWSISTELAFYLAFPFFVGFARRSPWATLWLAFGWVVSLIALCAASGMPIDGNTGPDAWDFLYAWPPVRFAEFLSGMAAYFIAARRPRRDRTAAAATAREAAALALCLVAMVVTTGIADAQVLGEQAGFWLRNAGAYPAFALLMIVLHDKAGRVSAALSARWLVLLGNASFALYLVHRPILEWMFMAHGEWARLNPGTAIAAFALSSIAASLAIHLLLDDPARKAAKRLLAARGNVSESLAPDTAA